MQPYNIKRGVFIIEGRVKASIYDCNNNKHYWVDNDVAAVFHRLTERTITDSDIDIIDAMQRLGLIEESHSMEPQLWPQIESLYLFPRHVDYAWIELTNQCNLKCTHCYNETAQRNKQFLTYEDFVHVVDEAVRYGIKAVQLIGGEPFMIPEQTLFDMLAYASKSFVEFEVFFNGTLTSRKHLERIKAEFPNCKIAMSLHSFIEKEHEKITQVSGSYKKSVATLRNLQELNMPFRYVGIYVAGLEVGEEMDFGVPYRRDYIRLTGRGNLAHYDRKLLKEKLITLSTFKFNDLEGTLKSNYSESCFANYFYIGSDMNLYPCVMERRFCHGNLRNHSLSEIVDRRLINFTKEQVEECQDCEFRHICKDCRPDSLSMQKNGKPWYCTYDVSKGVWQNPDVFIDELLQMS